MTRVVIDTSTLVGAVLHVHENSVPHRTWLLAQRSFEILACSETYTELATVLHRDRMSRYLDPAARDVFLALYQISVEWIAVSSSQIAETDPPCRDLKDNVFLALAAVGGAEFIVSSDHDLLVLNPWNGIQILTPAQFLARVES